ncbi:protein disulfide isomerase family protein 2-2 [Hordeum vulgare]|nr:protein disulfide isomerase family protein 2-2 [Hordeum vulgare]
MLLVNANTVRFLRRSDYSGERTQDAIVAWISKKLGPAVQNLTAVDEAKKIINGDDMAVLAYLHHLSGAHSDDLAAASRLEYTASFYQTTSPDVAKLFHIDPEAKRSSVVLLKKERRNGEFRVSAIAEFVSANKIPLITTLTQETAPAIFDNPIKKQILLFVVAKESSKFLPILKETTKSFKGKFNSQSSSISSQGGLGLGVQGPGIPSAFSSELQPHESQILEQYAGQTKVTSNKAWSMMLVWSLLQQLDGLSTPMKMK